MPGKVVTFGEIMLRLAPFNYERITQAQRFQVVYGGGEANVAVSLAHFGDEAYFVTRLPENAVGQAALNALRRYGVDTEFILRGGDRLGIYFLEHGASVRPSKVIYDRSNSAISEVQPDDFNWEMIFNDKDWFHVTGITPALSENCAEASIEAVKSAKKAGLTVSTDLNYRSKLWNREEAKKTMTKLVEYVDVVIANEEDAADTFGIMAEETDVTTGELDLEHYQSVAEQLRDYCDSDLVAITLRESYSASDNGWSAMLFDGEQMFQSRKYDLHLVDRVGGGDSFCAGLIHGLLSGWEKQQALEFAVAASGMKQTIPGDKNLVTESEVLNLSRGDASGRVQR